MSMQRFSKLISFLMIISSILCRAAPQREFPKYVSAIAENTMIYYYDPDKRGEPFLGTEAKEQLFRSYPIGVESALTISGVRWYVISEGTESPNSFFRPIRLLRERDTVSGFQRKDLKWVYFLNEKHSKIRVYENASPDISLFIYTDKDVMYHLRRPKYEDPKYTLEERSMDFLSRFKKGEYQVDGNRLKIQFSEETNIIAHRYISIPIRGVQIKPPSSDTMECTLENRKLIECVYQKTPYHVRQTNFGALGF